MKVEAGLASNRLPYGVSPLIPLVPCPEEIPEWSDETERLMADLSPLERGVVEWSACGLNGAEAYRKVKGRDYEGPDDSARNNAYSILSRPRVQAALASAMKDSSSEARLTRAWMLQRLEAAIIKVEKSDKPMDQEILGKLIEILARMKGEYTKAESESGDTKRVDVHVRINAVLADVSSLVSQRTGGSTPAVAVHCERITGGGDDDAVGAE